MKKYLMLIPLLALGFAATPAFAEPAAPHAQAQAQEQQKPKQASIPFVNYGGIRNWQVGNDHTLYIEDQFNHWYKADLMFPSFDLPYANYIGFDAGPVGTFDHFSQVVIAGQRYPITSLVRVEGPPGRHQHKETS